MPIKLIVFDFDGTLVHSNHIKRDTFFKVAEGLGSVRHELEKLLGQKGKDRFHIFSDLVDLLHQSQRLPSQKTRDEWYEELVARYTTETEKAIIIADEVEGAQSILERLWSSGKKLAINSATPTAPLLRVVEGRKLNQYFEMILGADHSKMENIKIIQEKWGIRPHETAVVGDNEADRVAAEKNGAVFVGLENEFSNFSVKPDELISNLNELERVIKKYD